MNMNIVNPSGAKKDKFYHQFFFIEKCFFLRIGLTFKEIEQ